MRDVLIRRKRMSLRARWAVGLGANTGGKKIRDAAVGVPLIQMCFGLPPGLGLYIYILCIVPTCISYILPIYIHSLCILHIYA